MQLSDVLGAATVTDGVWSANVGEDWLQGRSLFGGVQAALALTRIGGKVVLAGTVAPLGNVVFDPESVVRRWLTICGVHNYHPRDLAAALAFLAGPGREFPWESLVVAEYPLGRAEQAFADARARPGVRVAVAADAGKEE